MYRPALIHFSGEVEGERKEAMETLFSLSMSVFLSWCVGNICVCGVLVAGCVKAMGRNVSLADAAALRRFQPLFILIGAVCVCVCERAHVIRITSAPSSPVCLPPTPRPPPPCIHPPLVPCPLLHVATDPFFLICHCFN